MSLQSARRSVRWLPYFIISFAGLTLAIYSRSVLLKKGLPACPLTCLLILLLLGVGTLFVVLDFLSRCCQLISGADKHRRHFYQSLTFLPIFLLWSSILTQGNVQESIVDLRFTMIPTETLYQLMVLLMAAVFAVLMALMLRQGQKPAADRKSARVAVCLCADVVIVVLFISFGFRIFEYYVVSDIRKNMRRYCINGSTRTVEIGSIPSEVTFSAKSSGVSVLHSGIGVSKEMFQSAFESLLCEITITGKHQEPRKWFTAKIDRGSATGWVETSVELDNPPNEMLQLRMKVSYARGSFISGLLAPCGYYLRLMVMPQAHFDIRQRCALWIAPVTSSKREADDPSVVLIAIDTLRADHVSYCGYARKTTPHIDDLAHAGVAFRNCLSVSPWTLPSFFSIMTSTHPSVHQYGTNIRGVGSSMLKVANFWPVGSISPDYDIKTLAEILGERGYYTAAFVNNPFLSPAFEFDRGFKELNECGPTSQEATDQILPWLDKHKDERFFLFIHFMEPHLRVVDFGADGLPDPFGEAGASGIWKEIDFYDRTIRFCDGQIGRLVEKLDSVDLKRRTLVIVTADHGEEFSEHKGQGHGDNVYNETLLVPLVLHYPPFEGHGTTFGDRVSTLDIAPTILETLGLASPPYFQGRSLAPLIHGDTVPQRPLFAESLVYGHEKKALLMDNYKLIYTADLDTMELYDLNNDPRETRNLAGSLPNVEYGMRQALGQFINQSNRGIEVTIKPRRDGLGCKGTFSTDRTFLRVMPHSLTEPSFFRMSADAKMIHFTTQGAKETDGFTFEVAPSDASIRIELTQPAGQAEYAAYLGPDAANPLQLPARFNREMLGPLGVPRATSFGKEGIYIWLNGSRRKSKRIQVDSEGKQRLESLGYIAR